MSRKVKTIVALVLSLVLLVTSTLTAYAEHEVELHPDDTDDVVVRISNPDNDPRQADGLKVPGDRETGYGWSIAERGDYIYIGTWKNTVGVVVAAYLANALNDTDGDGIDDTDNSDLMWALCDVFTNGDIPRPTEGIGGEIVKMRKDDPGNFETIFTCDDSFRNVAVYGDDLYFATYAGPRIPYGAKAAIYKVDENDVTTRVYETAQGSSMRANAVLNDKLYFAGTYVTDEMKNSLDAETLANHAFLAVIEKHTEDDGWDLVADEDDFGAYCNDSYVTATAGSPFWDMAAHNGELYATIPGQTGFVIFAGHPAETGETANKYGWNWREVVGKTNGINNQGLNPTSSYGYTQPGQAGFLSVISALVEYKGELYTYDIDHTIVAEVNAVGGIADLLFGGDPAAHKAKAISYWLPLYSAIKHPQGLWKLDDATGKFEPVEGFFELMEGTTNEYVWKHGIYEDELYIGTMDSKVIYNYLTRFLGGNMADMTVAEWIDQLGYVKNLIELAATKGMIEEEQAGTAALAVDSVLQVLSYDNVFDKEAFLELVDVLFGTRENALTTLAMVSGILENINLILDGTKEEIIAAAEKGMVTLDDIRAQIEAIPGMSDKQFRKLADSAKDALKNFLREQYDLGPVLANVIANRIINRDLLAACKDVIESFVESKYWDNICEYLDKSKTVISGLIDSADTIVAIIREVIEAFPAEDYEDLLDFLYDNDYEELPGFISGMFYEMLLNNFGGLVDEGTSEVAAAITEGASGLTQILVGILNKFDTTFSGLDSDEALDVIKDFADALDDEIERLGLEKGFREAFDSLPATGKKELAGKLTEIADKIHEAVDWQAVALYLMISEAVREDVQGFDIVKTSDGENWSVVTNDGFGDKWNYGGLRFLPTDQGMYITTANPFYGTQLYLLTKDGVEPIGGGEVEIPEEIKIPSVDKPASGDQTSTFDGIDYSVLINEFNEEYAEYNELSFEQYPDLKKGTVYFHPMEARDYNGDHKGEDAATVFYYSDRFFDLPATVFNPHLSTLSAIATMSAFPSYRAYGLSELGEELEKDEHFQYQARNVVDMLYIMGFDNIEVNEDFMSKPEVDTIGYVIASKKIKTKDGESELVVFLPRIGDYGDEWVNNIIIGGEGDHAGLSERASECLDAINEYIDRNTDGDVKIWLSSASRSGGLVNVLGGMLDAEKDINDVYVYTFGAPNVAAKTETVYSETDQLQSEKDRDINGIAYANIFNIVEDYDLFSTFLGSDPSCPERGWNLGRYGIDVVISQSADSFPELLEETFMQMLIINPDTRYFTAKDETGKSVQAAENYIPLKFTEVALQFNEEAIAEAILGALSDMAEYLEENEQNEELAKIVADLSAFVQILKDSGVIDEDYILHPEKINTEAGKCLGVIINEIFSALGQEEASEILEQLVQDLVKGVYVGEKQESATIAEVLRRFTKTYNYATTRQRYADKYEYGVANYMLDLLFMSNNTRAIFVENTEQAISDQFDKYLEDFRALSDIIMPDEDNKVYALTKSIIEETLEQEDSPVEKFAIVAAMITDILKIDQNVAEAIASGMVAAGISSEDELLLAADGSKAVIRYFARMLTASIRYPDKFDTGMFESINTLLSVFNFMENTTSAHDSDVMVAMARAMDCFYELSEDANDFNKLAAQTVFEKTGYRTVMLPDSDRVSVSVIQKDTEAGSNSKVEDGEVLTWNAKDGLTGRTDPSVFVNVYDWNEEDSDGLASECGFYGNGVFLFLPLDHSYEIVITTDKKVEFDMAAYEHSYLGSYKNNNLLRCVTEDENSDVSHTGIILESCDTLTMTVESFTEEALDTAMEFSKEGVGTLTIPETAFYPISVETFLFIDVTDSKEYYFAPVYWAEKLGITKGYEVKGSEDRIFGVGYDCTREDMITFLWRAAGKPEPTITESPFSDVALGKYYTKAVLWAYETGITKGYSEGDKAGTFGVGETVTREDTVTFLYRMAGKPEVTSTDISFSDVEAGKYYTKAIIWAADNGITKGYATGDKAGTFGVGENCLREQIITFLYRFAHL